MIEPLISAIEVWLAIWDSLPDSIVALANLCFGLFLIAFYFRLFVDLRG